MAAFFEGFISLPPPTTSYPGAGFRYFLTYLLCVTPMLECRNSSLAANASPVSSVKTVAAPLRPAYSPFHCRPFAFSVGAMVNLTRVFRSRGNTRSLSPAF